MKDLTGSNTRGGGLGITAIENTADITFDLNIENTGDFGALIDGQSEITGINMNMRLSSETLAPGVNINGISGTFGLSQWTPSSFNNVVESTKFTESSNPVLGGTGRTISSSNANLFISMRRFSTMSRAFTQTPSLNIGINAAANFKLLQNGRSGNFNISEILKL